MRDAIALGLAVLGGSFLAVAAIGIVRMPDLFLRMQPATKASTLGVGCMMLAVAVRFGTAGIAVRALLVSAFIFLTAPVAAHMIGRAAYFIRVPLWKGTIIDELRGRYDPETHALGSPGDLLGSDGGGGLDATGEARDEEPKAR